MVILAALIPLAVASCTSHKIESTNKIETTSKVDTTHKIELEVKPMYIKIDVNLKVDKEIEDFFGDIDKRDATMQSDGSGKGETKKWASSR